MHTYRPVELAREHGLTAQAIRNYEERGVLPPAERTATGYRIYTDLHAIALRAYLAQLPAHGYATGGEILRAINNNAVDDALRAVDRSHAQLLRDRETLDVVEAAIGVLTEPAADRPDRLLPVSAVAQRLSVSPATLRKWERAGILTPQRDLATGYRLYSADDVRDAELAHLLRRGGYLLAHIATVVEQVRTAGGVDALAASLAGWRERLTDRGRAMLTAAGRLDDYLRYREQNSTATD
ncbi:TioE family transcriptional regulator [Cryptosporangium aurantiacum]|uniref:DNA-binding transcriptional regulator, MerR family n=1 Tax=Cryptosporangium aurantiacum TaxID=134849 RepID=A0A1M7RDF2_9ACTN|nr:TioE family transcriptional regulator [Cryptosporangium aurantiacum]SHN44345.1 DNA-binding transcriptional regulator, MerR family [Cryptosporangium aurantiacum]